MSTTTPPTTLASGSSSAESSASSSPAPAKPFASSLQKDVTLRFGRGEFNCSNGDHYKLIHPKGHQYPHAIPKGHASILSMMEPYKKASCACERAALSVASSRNYTGMLQNQWVMRGADHIGVGKMDQTRPAKRVMGLGYSLSDSEFAFLHKRHPDWIFIVLVANGHDHPIAHTSTKVCMFNLMLGLRKGTDEKPRKVLDLYGNPGMNEQFNNRESAVKITTNCFAWTPKDFGRRIQKWGEPVVDGTRRYYECDLRTLEGLDDVVDCPRLEDFDEVVACHSLYYYTPDNICSLVNKSGKPLTAIMHKFEPGRKAGTFCDGELSWERFDQDGERRIAQTTVRTGIRYTHYDNQWVNESTIWAHSGSELAEMGERKRLGRDGKAMAWDIREFNDETMSVMFYPIPAACYNMAVDQGERCTTGTASAPIPQGAKKKSAAVKATGVAEVVIGTKTIKYEIPALANKVFEDGRVRMADKPRTPSQFRDHSAWVKREIKGPMKSSGGLITADCVSDVTHASFWMDLASDMRNADAESWSKFAASVRSDKLYSSGHTGMVSGTFDFILETAHTALSSKNGKEALCKGISSFRLLSKLK
jgi:hypothetical protein